MPTSEHCWKKKLWRKVGANQQPLDYSPNAYQTKLRREICKVGFIFLLILYGAKVSIYGVKRRVNQNELSVGCIQ